MNSATSTFSAAKQPLSLAFLLCAAVPAVLLVLVQWRFSQLTGSVLVMGQGVLQLGITFGLLFVVLDTRWKWLGAFQFANSVLMLLLCGYLVNESYIHWQESQSILTAEALAVGLLGCSGLFLLSRLVAGKASAHLSVFGRRIGTVLLPVLSTVIGTALVIIHMTGWSWLDPVIACATALLFGLVAIGFLLDAYWHLLEREAARS